MKEVLAGRMIGGPGWSALTVREFFGGKNFYGIPCGATEKNGDPFCRIVHDYGYFPKGSYSINSTHSSTDDEGKDVNLGRCSLVYQSRPRQDFDNLLPIQSTKDFKCIVMVQRSTQLILLVPTEKRTVRWSSAHRWHSLQSRPL